MKNKGQQFKNICEKMLSTYEKKNHDYGDSFSQTVDKFGLIAAGVRMHDKLERFITISNRVAKVGDESMRDTLLDLANYAIMTLMYLDDKEIKENQIIENPIKENPIRFA